ncbi:unnamed protein product [Vitrella brassicaformis CCMP3155]|uniref:Uncharacterized protein n=3 Tax=Vitrella brassicaformis TaxID=1169539 RepID=A0A0G4EQL2_VITBC|nr:unnamed protein product [Vitrella brassicaformis CCMP3155]|eukprot:CEL99523.1 unnamed protein product [Vitrella brassicaformis CCMP3155]
MSPGENKGLFGSLGGFLGGSGRSRSQTQSPPRTRSMPADKSEASKSGSGSDDQGKKEGGKESETKGVFQWMRQLVGSGEERTYAVVNLGAHDGEGFYYCKEHKMWMERGKEEEILAKYAAERAPPPKAKKKAEGEESKEGEGSKEAASKPAEVAKTGVEALMAVPQHRLPYGRGRAPYYAATPGLPTKPPTGAGTGPPRGGQTPPMPGMFPMVTPGVYNPPPILEAATDSPPQDSAGLTNDAAPARPLTEGGEEVPDLSPKVGPPIKPSTPIALKAWGAGPPKKYPSTRDRPIPPPPTGLANPFGVSSTPLKPQAAPTSPFGRPASEGEARPIPPASPLPSAVSATSQPPTNAFTSPASVKASPGESPGGVGYTDVENEGSSEEGWKKLGGSSVPSAAGGVAGSGGGKDKAAKEEGKAEDGSSPDHSDLVVLSSQPDHDRSERSGVSSEWEEVGSKTTPKTVSPIHQKEPPVTQPPVVPPAFPTVREADEPSSVSVPGLDEEEVKYVYDPDFDSHEWADEEAEGSDDHHNEAEATGGLVRTRQRGEGSHVHLPMPSPPRRGQRDTSSGMLVIAGSPSHRGLMMRLHDESKAASPDEISPVSKASPPAATQSPTQQLRHHRAPETAEETPTEAQKGYTGEAEAESPSSSPERRADSRGAAAAPQEQQQQQPPPQQAASVDLDMEGGEPEADMADEGGDQGWDIDLDLGSPEVMLPSGESEQRMAVGASPSMLPEGEPGDEPEGGRPPTGHEQDGRFGQPQLPQEQPSITTPRDDAVALKVTISGPAGEAGQLSGRSPSSFGASSPASEPIGEAAAAPAASAGEEGPYGIGIATDEERVSEKAPSQAPSSPSRKAIPDMSRPLESEPHPQMFNIGDEAETPAGGDDTLQTPPWLRSMDDIVPPAHSHSGDLAKHGEPGPPSDELPPPRASREVQLEKELERVKAEYQALLVESQRARDETIRLADANEDLQSRLDAAGAEQDLQLQEALLKITQLEQDNTRLIQAGEEAARKEQEMQTLREAQAAQDKDEELAALRSEQAERDAAIEALRGRSAAQQEEVDDLTGRLQKEERVRAALEMERQGILQKYRMGYQIETEAQRNWRLGYGVMERSAGTDNEWIREKDKEIRDLQVDMAIKEVRYGKGFARAINAIRKLKWRITTMYWKAWSEEIKMLDKNKALMKDVCERNLTISELNQRITKMVWEKHDVKKALMQQKVNNDALQKTVDEYVTAIAGWKECCAKLEKNGEEMMAKANAELQRGQTMLDDLAEKHNTVMREYNQLKAETDATVETERDKIRTEATEKIQELTELFKNQLVQRNETIAHWQSVSREREEQLTAVTQQLDTARQEQQQLRSSLQAYESTIEQTKARECQLLQEMHQIQETQRTHDASFESFQRKEDELQRQLQTNKAEMQRLESLCEQQKVEIVQYQAQIDAYRQEHDRQKGEWEAAVESHAAEVRSLQRAVEDKEQQWRETMQGDIDSRTRSFEDQLTALHQELAASRELTEAKQKQLEEAHTAMQLREGEATALLQETEKRMQAANDELSEALNAQMSLAQYYRELADSELPAVKDDREAIKRRLANLTAAVTEFINGTGLSILPSGHAATQPSPASTKTKTTETAPSFDTPPAPSSSSAPSSASRRDVAELFGGGGDADSHGFDGGDSGWDIGFDPTPSPPPPGLEQPPVAGGAPQATEGLTDEHLIAELKKVLSHYLEVTAASKDAQQLAEQAQTQGQREQLELIEAMRQDIVAKEQQLATLGSELEAARDREASLRQDLHNRIQSLESEHRENGDLRAQLEMVRQHYDELHAKASQLDGVDATVRQLREELHTKEGEIEILKNVDEDMRRQIADNLSRVVEFERLEAENRAQKERLDYLESRAFDEGRFSDDLQAKDQRITALTNELQKLRDDEAMHREETQGRLNQLQKELSESITNCTRLQEENNRIRLDLERTQHDLATSHENMATGVEDVDKMHAALVEENGRLLREVDIHKEAADEAAQKVDVLQTECATLKEELDKSREREAAIVELQAAVSEKDTQMVEMKKELAYFQKQLQDAAFHPPLPPPPQSGTRHPSLPPVTELPHYGPPQELMTDGSPRAAPISHDVRVLQERLKYANEEKAQIAKALQEALDSVSAENQGLRQENNTLKQMLGAAPGATSASSSQPLPERYPVISTDALPTHLATPPRHMPYTAQSSSSDPGARGVPSPPPSEGDDTVETVPLTPLGGSPRAGAGAAPPKSSGWSFFSLFLTESDERAIERERARNLEL